MGKKFTPATTDQNFDHLAHTFKDAIYGTLKGRIRLAVLERDFAELKLASPDRPLRILDAGGGNGQFSARLAAQGHSLVLCDLSANMLVLAKEEYRRVCPQADAEFLHCGVQSLPESLAGSFDLILFHAVLEWLIEPEQTLRSLCRFLKPGGRLSVLFYNRNSLIFRHLVMGNFMFIRKGYLRGNGTTLTPINPLLPEEVAAWLQDEGLAQQLHSGVRCFHDFMTPEARQRVSEEEVLEMELAHSRQEPFRGMARYVHMVYGAGDC